MTLWNNQCSWCPEESQYWAPVDNSFICHDLYCEEEYRATMRRLNKHEELYEQLGGILKT